MIGTCFFTPNNPGIGVPRHLWIVLGGPGQETGRIVIANFSTIPCPEGDNCIVNQGEHEKISHKSYVRFDRVQLPLAVKIQKLIDTNQCQETTEASTELLEKIQEALKNSKHVPQEAISLMP